MVVFVVISQSRRRPDESVEAVVCLLLVDVDCTHPPMRMEPPSSVKQREKTRSLILPFSCKDGRMYR